MHVKVPACLCALALAALLPGSAAVGEEATPLPLMVVHLDQVDPANADEFEAWLKEWVAAFKEAGLGPEWNWYALSSPEFEYVTATPIGAYSFFDQQKERQKQMAEALGKERTDKLMEGLNLVQSHRNEILKVRPDLSYQPKGGGDPEASFLSINVQWVRPGMEKPFEELVKKVVKAYTDTEQPGGFEAYEVQFGEGSYVFLSRARSAAAYYQQPGTGKVLTSYIAAAEGP